MTAAEDGLYSLDNVQGTDLDGENDRFSVAVSETIEALLQIAERLKRGDGIDGVAD